MPRLLIVLLLVLLAGCSSNSFFSAAPAWHTVAKGETLYSIARQYGQDFKRLASRNQLKKPYTIFPGQKLRVALTTSARASSTHAPYSGNQTSPYGGNQVTPWKGAIAKPWQGNLKQPWQGEADQKKQLAANTSKPAKRANSGAAYQAKKNAKATSGKYSKPKITSSKKPSPKVKPKPSVRKSVAALTGVNKKHSSNNSKKWRALKWRWPANGTVSGRFSPSRELQQGIDIAGRKNASVTAAEAGKVIYSGSGLRGYGKLVIIKHSELFISAYAHNQLLLVKKGDFVKSGQKIAEMGSTPQKKVHLHFQIRYDGRAVDPLKYLPKRVGG